MKRFLLGLAIAAASQLAMPAFAQNPFASVSEPVVFGESFSVPSLVLAEDAK